MKVAVRIVLVVVILSVGVMGQQRQLTVDKSLAMEAHKTLDDGGYLYPDQVVSLFDTTDGGELIALFLPEREIETSRAFGSQARGQLRGALRFALGVDGPLRPCTLDEIYPIELTAMIRPAHGGHCRGEVVERPAKGKR